MPSDHDLAWALADHIAPDLVDHDKTAIYVDLGCGNGWEAIGHMLNVTVRDSSPAATAGSGVLSRSRSPAKAPMC
jgi:hypothetical protein